MQQKKRDRAVAINYQSQSDRAPRVTAKGEGLIAQKIKAIALAQGIPLHRDDDLVELLAQTEINREIPPELYAAIAELLSWIYRANDALKRRNVCVEKR